MTPQLVVAQDPGEVWRVGYRPRPWDWPDWRYATDHGRFNGRWDDQLAEFRTLYTGESLEACLLEVLAHFRPEPGIDRELDEISDEDGWIALFPDAPAGTVGAAWAADRMAGAARQTGAYCFITHSESLGAVQIGFPFGRFGLVPRLLDTSVVKNPDHRDLTRSIARWLFDQPGADGRAAALDGVAFRSRFGDELRLWAVFERPEDAEEGTSHCLRDRTEMPLEVQGQELSRVFAVHGLRWADSA